MNTIRIALALLTGLTACGSVISGQTGEGGSGGEGGATSSGTTTGNPSSTSSSNPTGAGSATCEQYCAKLDECDLSTYSSCIHDCLVEPGCEAQAGAMFYCAINTQLATCEYTDTWACYAEADAYAACENELPACTTQECTGVGTENCNCIGQCGEFQVEARCSPENEGGGHPEDSAACDCYVNGQFTGSSCSQQLDFCSTELGCCKWVIDNY
jgi:hypothetical protein